MNLVSEATASISDFSPLVGHIEILPASRDLNVHFRKCIFSNKKCNFLGVFNKRHSQFANGRWFIPNEKTRYCDNEDTIFFLIARFANCEYRLPKMLKAPALKPQDVLVVCKLFSLGDAGFTYAGLALALDISVSEMHDSMKRCRAAQLVITVRNEEIVSKRHFCDLLTIAVPRIFFAVRGGIEKGMPTSTTQSNIARDFEAFDPTEGKNQVPVVWPDPKGTVRGESLLPLYATAPEASRKDPVLYDLLALADVMRVGDFRSKKRATELLEKKILGKVSE